MINMKRLLTNVLNTLKGKVSKDGDTMSGNLIVRTNDTSYVEARTVNSQGNMVAGGSVRSTASGDFGVYDVLHGKWAIRIGSDNRPHVPIFNTLLYSTKRMANTVGIAYTYISAPALANWNMVAVRFVVHENSQILYFTRGETIERSLTDWPSAGKFRGTILVDWGNKRIGIRCINAPSGKQNLVYFDYVYGVL